MKIYTLILLFLSASSFGQKDSILSFSGVVKVDSASKDELYNRARTWFASTYNDASKVLQIQDKEAGQITGKGAKSFSSPVIIAADGVTGVISYMVTILVKEGRYRYEITDFIHDPNGSDEMSLGVVSTAETCNVDVKYVSKSWMKKVWSALQASSKSEGAFLENSLLEGMQKPAKSDNW